MHRGKRLSHDKKNQDRRCIYDLGKIDLMLYHQSSSGIGVRSSRYKKRQTFLRRSKWFRCNLRFDTVRCQDLLSRAQ